MIPSIQERPRCCLLRGCCGGVNDFLSSHPRRSDAAPPSASMAGTQTMYATFNLVLEPPNARQRIIGELDIADEPQLRRNCADLLDCGSGAVSLDLEHLCFIDCSCLRTLDVLRHELAVAE